MSGDFAIQSSQVFLEIGPVGGTKRSTVQQILADFSSTGSAVIYIGDDDKDEDAFSEIKAHGGYAILVSEHTRPTAADARFQSPAQVRAWLQKLLAQHSHG
jgi:trehalose-phosphatase